MIDGMYQFDELAAAATESSRRSWVCARGFELVHSGRVASRMASPASGPGDHPGSDLAGGTHDDFLVSVLREEWPECQEQCRVRVRHAVAGVGPLTAVITGPPVPLVIRLDRGDSSIAHHFYPARIDLEIRLGGQAPGAMALPRFPLQASSSYTIVIGAGSAGTPDIQEWSEAHTHAE